MIINKSVLNNLKDNILFYAIIIIFIGIIQYNFILKNAWHIGEQYRDLTIYHEISFFNCFFSYQPDNSSIYRPFILIFLKIIYAIFGVYSKIYWYISLAIHILNSILLFLIFEFLYKNKFAGFVLSILFLIHPINL